jgi:hypothetical protein
MSRLEWILGIVLVVLLGIVIVLSLIFWFQPEAPVISSQQTELEAIIADQADNIAPTSVFVGQTAKAAFAAAQREAMAWQEDAVLLNASAAWPQGASQQQVLDGETTWGFTFYSETTGTFAMISVVENQANLVSRGENPQQATQPLDASGWRVDSRAAIRQFLDEGGTTFMDAAGVTNLIMRLSTDNQSGRIEWFVSLFATQSGGSFTMRIDATSGEVLSVEEA